MLFNPTSNPFEGCRLNKKYHSVNHYIRFGTSQCNSWQIALTVERQTRGDCDLEFKKKWFYSWIKQVTEIRNRNFESHKIIIFNSEMWGSSLHRLKLWCCTGEGFYSFIPGLNVSVLTLKWQQYVIMKTLSIFSPLSNLFFIIFKWQGKEILCGYNVKLIIIILQHVIWYNYCTCLFVFQKHVIFIAPFPDNLQSIYLGLVQ